MWPVSWTNQEVIYGEPLQDPICWPLCVLALYTLNNWNVVLVVSMSGYVHFISDVLTCLSFAVAVFGGHLNSSFDVKSTVSPDNQFLASGSSDHHAYIWKVSCHFYLTNPVKTFEKQTDRRWLTNQHALTILSMHLLVSYQLIFRFQIADPKQPPMMLQGHRQQVTSIAWCPTDFTKVRSQVWSVFT